MDFVTGLTLPQGKTVILTIVDRFSRSVHFVALAKLLSTLEAAKLLITHVFCLHGISVDIVSVRVHSLSPRCGRDSAVPWEPQQPYHQAIILRRMDKQSAKTKTWKRLFGAYASNNGHRGTHICLGWNTPTTLSRLQPGLPSQQCITTNHHCSRLRRGWLRSPWCSSI